MSDTSVRTRKNVWTLTGQDDDLAWYAKAVAALQNKPISDPTSWRYMAAVHGYPGHSADPFAASGEALPAAADQKSFWNQCQHHSWFFLPWHRAYLAAFEEIVADAVVTLGGPSGWALPYWNYDYQDPDPAHPSDGAALNQWRQLPPAFLDQDSALWTAQRDLPNEAPPYILPQDVSLNCLTHAGFDDPQAGDHGFGGPKTGFHHGADGAEGWIEQVPHDSVHGDIGGFMGAFDTAALDPVFWLHHANIDRLWEVWRQRFPQFKDVTDRAWLNPTPKFRLHDKAGAVWSFTPQDMLDTTKVRHGYRYDDIADPLPGHLAPATAAMAAAQPPLTPELVAASEQVSIGIVAPATTIRLRFDDAARRAATARLQGGRTLRATLAFENVTGSGGSSNIRVVVGAPGPAGDAVLAGHFSLFGLSRASSAADPHGGGGLTKTLDLSRVLARLQQDGWDGASLEVTLTPTRPGRAGAVPDDLRVGRVSLYYC